MFTTQLLFASITQEATRGLIYSMIHASPLNQTPYRYETITVWPQLLCHKKAAASHCLCVCVGVGKEQWSHMTYSLCVFSNTVKKDKADKQVCVCVISEFLMSLKPVVEVLSGQACTLTPPWLWFLSHRSMSVFVRTQSDDTFHYKLRQLCSIRICAMCTKTH